MLLLVGVYSRFCTVYLLRKRSEFLDYFIKYKVAAENRHNRHLNKFISDNGGEYVSDAFKAFCEEQGVERRTAMTYTPERNGGN